MSSVGLFLINNRSMPWLYTSPYLDNLFPILMPNVSQDLTHGNGTLGSSVAQKIEHLDSNYCSTLRIPLYTDPKLPLPTKLAKENPSVAFKRLW